MTDLNYRTDQLKQTPERVAKEYLLRNALFKAPKGGKAATVRIGSKIFGEQYILAEMYRMLIEGNTEYSVDTKTGLGGTKICFDALMNDQIDFYPEYTGTGLLVLLQPDPKIVSSISRDKEKTYGYVKAAFHKEYKVKWLKPIGFNNSYALMMRKKQSQALNVNTITELKKYLDQN
jgi:osmoprotectant transport system permease protein